MEEKTIRKIISGNIKRLIKESGIKSKDFADKVGVSKSLISKYKSGDNFFPLLKVPLATEILKCTVNDLFSPLFYDIRALHKTHKYFYINELQKASFLIFLLLVTCLFTTN